MRSAGAVYDKRRGSVLLRFETLRHLMPAEYFALQGDLEACCGKNVAVCAAQRDHAGRLLEDPAQAARLVKDCCVLRHPLILPFVAPARVEVSGSAVRILMPDQEGPELFRSLRLQETVSRFLADSYGLSLPVTVECDARADEKYEAPAGALAPPEPTASSRSHEQELRAGGLRAGAPGAEAADKMAALPVSRIADLVADGRYAIEGRVFLTTSRETKSGRTVIHTIRVTDYTASATVIYFERKSAAGGFKVPAKGSWVRVLGCWEFDRYAKERTLKASSLAVIEHEGRRDNAPEKRVELHAHTKMSRLDAVTDVEELIRTAAAWGHEAVAITDHGVTQAFPAAAGAAAKAGLKLIYGTEAYMFDDMTPVWEGPEETPLETDVVVFDLETTGLSALCAEITEIGAVRLRGGEVTDVFQTYVAIRGSIPQAVTDLTGITNEMLEGAPSAGEAVAAFLDFCGDSPLAAHNAAFDTAFLKRCAASHGLSVRNPVLDTLLLAQIAFPSLGSYKLQSLLAHLGHKLDAHHAYQDAEGAGKLLTACLATFREHGAQMLSDLNRFATPEALARGSKTYHVILLCRNKRGMADLNRLVSMSHIEFLGQKKPRMPKSAIAALRKNLIVGSACESGELFRAVVQGTEDEKLAQIASFYDYLEVQPIGNNAFLLENGSASDEEDLRNFNRKILELGEKIGKPVAATCDVHFLEPEDACYREVIQYSMGYGETKQPPLYMRTTEEMLEEFSYLPPRKAHEIVVETPRAIAAQVESFELLPRETVMPVIEGASERLEKMAYENAKEMYGDPLPEIVRARLQRELGSIIGHGFSVLYYSAHLLVKKSNEDGYLVGSRGSVGSSLAATMTGITEVNPLPPHYLCPSCRHSDFEVDLSLYDCGADLPDAVCPVCGTPYTKHGFNIPFEVFLGIDADKVPDIDLNFSGEYQNRAHKYTEEIFGKGHVFRAGTISSLQENTAFGYAKHYLTGTGRPTNSAEVERLRTGLQGVKRTTGQHPGGMVIVPRGREVYEFTAVQWPANESGAEFVTTHFDFSSMHDVLVKLDILGHDAPTIMRLVQDITGLDPLEIPIADKTALRLFSSIEPLGIEPADLFGITKGTLGIPEFGTAFVRQMLEDTKPSTVAEIIRISGLAHGTNVWLGNAQDLIRDGTCTLRDAICARDDIMNYLVARGVDKREAFFIMEDTRKGKTARNGFSAKAEALLAEADIPEWFLGACRKIQYLFPKGHAVAYCLMALRIAYCKVHHMEAFYATYFDVNLDKFDCTWFSEGLPGIRHRYAELQAGTDPKDGKPSDTGKAAASILELAAEMYLRGLEFLPVDLLKSDPVRFTIEDGGLRMPLASVPGLGLKVAQAVAAERAVRPFLSEEDLRRRTKLGSGVAALLRRLGGLGDLSERDQLSLFD